MPSLFLSLSIRTAIIDNELCKTEKVRLVRLIQITKFYPKVMVSKFDKGSTFGQVLYLVFIKTSFQAVSKQRNTCTGSRPDSTNVFCWAINNRRLFMK